MVKRVQLGSGDRYKAGWVNVDLYAPDADVREDIRAVDFKPESVETVLCVHVIEHIEEQAALNLCSRIARWLIPGGKVEIETPDRKKCLQLIAEGAYLLGAKGLLGGRSVDKPGWHSWLEKWAQREGIETEIKESNIGAVAYPNKWELPGERHLYCWEGRELSAVLEAHGLEAKVGDPKHHGGKAWRDCRVVGVK